MAGILPHGRKDGLVRVHITREKTIPFLLGCHEDLLFFIYEVSMSYEAYIKKLKPSELEQNSGHCGETCE